MIGNRLEALARRLANTPDFGTSDYAEWIQQKDTLGLLDFSKFDEYPLLIGVRNFYLIAVLGDRQEIEDSELSDLSHWEASTDSRWGIELSYGHGGSTPKVAVVPPHSEVFRGGPKTESLFVIRRFDGRMRDKTYVEINPKISHIFDLHFVPERSAYCRFDENGDIENVISIRLENYENNYFELITANREVMDIYSSIEKKSLVFLIDSTRFSADHFSGWENAIHTIEKGPDFFVRFATISSVASYSRGIKIVTPTQKQKDAVEKIGFGRENKNFESFLIYNFKTGEVVTHTCDPNVLGNYFEESDAPYYTSPAFFRGEVLSKYKSNSDKYVVTERTIRCKNAWYLRGYDINDDGQVHVLVGDLSVLPYSEQQYWKSFNEPPKGPISQRSFQTDFEGSFDYEPSVSEALKRSIREFESNAGSLWRLKDEELAKRILVPATPDRQEWFQLIHVLDKVIVEGFNQKKLREHLIKLKGELTEKESNFGSIKLFDQIISHVEPDSARRAIIVSPIFKLHDFRTQMGAHILSSQAKNELEELKLKFGDLRNHAMSLMAELDVALREAHSLGELGADNENHD